MEFIIGIIITIWALGAIAGGLSGYTGEIK